MPRKVGADQPPLSTWQAINLRLTAFPSPAAQFAEPTWWSDLIGNAPEKRISKPKRLEQQEEGPFEGGNLILSVQPSRIDWVLTTLKEQERGQELSVIGSFPVALDKYLKLVVSWLSSRMCPPLERLAFGAILLQPVEDRTTGYRQLSTYVHSVDLDPEGTSDFFYQINRPRESRSGIPGLRINRLSKWSRAGLQDIEVTLAPVPRQTAGPVRFACHLELDINTAHEFRNELPQEQLSQIFQELVDLGKEIASKGDIP